MTNFDYICKTTTAISFKPYRRTRIKNNWNFDCNCIRCKDSTELGTNIDAVLCLKCRKNKQNENETTSKMSTEATNDCGGQNSNCSLGYKDGEAGPYMLPKDSLDHYGPWICNKCNEEVGGFTIYSCVKELLAEVEAIKGK